MKEELELRMYFLVPYNISPIQKSIQAGHAALEYARNYGDTDLFKEFVDNHKTWIILNGGTTNNNPKNPGTLQELAKKIQEFNLNPQNLKNNPISYAIFFEPDLNDALTAICFICDQRVWDREMVSDWKYYSEDYYNECDGVTELEEDELYELWKKDLGGERNVFLREEILKGLKLA